MSKSRQEKENERHQSYWQNMSQQAYANTQQVTPLEQKYTDAQIKFLDWDNSPNKNVMDAPGMDSYIQIGRAAQQRANQERMGTGALALADDGGSGYAQKLKSLQQAQMGEDFGTGLEDALALRRAEATGSVLPLAQLQQGRNNSQLSAATGMTGMYLNRPQRQPFWQQLLLGATQGAGAAAIGAYGKK